MSKRSKHGKYHYFRKKSKFKYMQPGGDVMQAGAVQPGATPMPQSPMQPGTGVTQPGTMATQPPPANIPMTQPPPATAPTPVVARPPQPPVQKKPLSTAALPLHYEFISGDLKRIGILTAVVIAILVVLYVFLK
jgi:hypothetical protein